MKFSEKHLSNSFTLLDFLLHKKERCNAECEFWTDVADVVGGFSFQSMAVLEGMQPRIEEGIDLMRQEENYYTNLNWKEKEIQIISGYFRELLEDFLD